MASARSLHDRLLVVDAREAFTVGQSFNALAKRAPTSFVRVDPETVKTKIEAHRAMWAAATPVV
jgi:hypothetical protein